MRLVVGNHKNGHSPEPNRDASAAPQQRLAAGNDGSLSRARQEFRRKVETAMNTPVWPGWDGIMAAGVDKWVQAVNTSTKESDLPAPFRDWYGLARAWMRNNPDWVAEQADSPFFP